MLPVLLQFLVLILQVVLLADVNLLIPQVIGLLRRIWVLACRQILSLFIIIFILELFQGALLDSLDQVVLADAESLFNVVEDLKEILVLFQQSEDLVLVFVCRLDEKTVEQTQRLVSKELVRPDVDEADHQLWHFGREHHLLPLTQLRLQLLLLLVQLLSRSDRDVIAAERVVVVNHLVLKDQIQDLN